MKGKVNCTCGWSWNKSDSSVKDMYVCHQCGRDNSNNMKNGGWMDNYNDSQASAPEGMVGDGFSNVGRNYSPAWGGQFEEGGEIPQAQFGLPINPIMPLVGIMADKFNDWFGDDEPVKKPVVPTKKKSTDRTLAIVDPRKKMATTNQPLRPNSDLVGGEYNSNHLDKLMQEAKRQKLSKQDMMNLSAMGFQETKWGRSDGNIGHVQHSFDNPGSLNEYVDFIDAYKSKMKLADRLKIKDPALRLQVYNGLGTITPKTEKDYHGFEMQKIYGVPIPKGGIDMAKNPLYGKQVMDIRDNVLAKNPEYLRYMDSIYKAPVPGYMQDVRKNKLVVPPLAMGGSIPGAVGFSYARTIDPAPSEGPYAKKTMPSAQEGEQVLPNNNRALKILADIQKRKQGKGKASTEFSKVKIKDDREEAVKKVDNTSTAYKPKVTDVKKLNVKNKTKAELAEQERKADEAIAAKRKAVREKADANPLNQGLEFFDSKNQTRQNWEDSTAGLESKFRFSDEPNFFDDYINPASWVGRMSANLGAAPNQIVQQDSMMPLVSSIAEPVLGGAIGPILGKYISKAVKPITTPINEAISPVMKKAGNLFGKQKAKGPNYRLITDEDLSLSDFNKASKQQIKSIGEKNVYKDVAKSESKRHRDLMRDIEEYGEGWKYLDDDIASSAKQAADAKAEWTNYLDAQEANIKTNPEYFNNTPDELVYYKGKGLGKQELEQLAKEQVDQWYAIQEYKGTRPNTKGYISDVEDYMGDPKYMLPGNRFNREAMLRDMGDDAMNSFNKMYKNQNWKPNIGDIPLNKQGGVIKSDRGQWDYPGQVTEIDQSKEGSYIDMGPDPKTGKPITQDILAVSDTGDVRLMRPGGKYKLEGKKVVEYPIAQDGIVKPNILEGKKFLDELKANTAAKKNKVNIRETPPAVVNDNIPNASKMAAKADEARVKDVRNSNRIAAEKAQAQRDAQRQFNALPKEEQERVLYEQYNREHGTISQYEPDSMLETIGNVAVAPMSALKAKMETGRVPDNLVKGLIENPEQINPYDAAYLGTLGYLAAPYVASAASAAAPYMAANAVNPITGATLTGVNLNNLLTAGFATHGLMNAAPDAAEWAENPSWEKAGELGMDALEIAPIVGPGAKLIGEGMGYLGNKGRQAINAVKESTPYLAMDKAAERKLSERLIEIQNERHQLHYGNHNNEVDDAFNKLAEEEWKIMQKMDKRRPYANVGDQAIINIKNRQIDKANQFTLNDEGLYQSKVDHPLGFKQGSSEIIDLETGEMFPISVKGSGVEAVQKMDDQGNVIKTVTNTSEPTMNEDYIRVLNRNIDYIEKNVPGAKVYGSTRTAGELGVPHVTGEMAKGKPFYDVGDYDVYMTQSNYEKHFGKKSGIDYSKPQNHAGPGEHGKDLQMQVNVIPHNAQGKATGEKALELFRQWEPDEFFQAAKEAMKKGKDAKIEIPYTSEQLIEKVNPTVKTVMDAYEAWKNEKNINKIDGIINYGNPDVVLEGQEKFIKGLLGSRGNLGHQFDVSQFADVNENLKILKDINFIGNPSRVAKDPKRMQIAINDFYINNSVLARQVKDIPLDDLATYESALGTYDASAPGGAFNGIGQNNTTLGNVGHYNPPFGSAMPRDYVTGVKQYKLNLDTSNPRSYIDSIKHTTSGSKLFTQEEKDILHEITQKYAGKLDGYSPERSDTTTQLVNNLPKSEEAKALMYEFAKKTNRRLNVQEGNTYVGGSTYVSALDDFDEALDVMTYAYGEQYNFDNALKSFQKRLQQSKMTSSQQINTLSDELLPKEFKQIEGYLKGGMDKAKERVSQLQDELAKLNMQKGDFVQRAASRKLGGLRTQIEAKIKIHQDEIKSLTDNAREIQQRLDKVDKFKSHSREIAKGLLIGGSAVGVFGVGLNAYDKMDKRRQKEYKEFFEQQKAEKKADSIYKEELRKMNRNTDSILMEPSEFKEKYQRLQEEEKRKMIEEREEQQRKADSIQQREDRPSSVKFMDWFMGRKQSGGKITKAKDGNQLVKLDQLTNFTNYNKPQPGGWLSKYE